MTENSVDSFCMKNPVISRDERCSDMPIGGERKDRFRYDAREKEKERDRVTSRVIYAIKRETSAMVNNLFTSLRPLSHFIIMQLRRRRYRSPLDSITGGW